MGQGLLSKECHDKLHFKSGTQAFLWCSWKSQGWAMKYKFLHNKQTNKQTNKHTKNDCFICTFSLQSNLTSQSGDWAYPMWHEKSLRTPHPLFHMCEGLGKRPICILGVNKRNIRGSEARLCTASAAEKVGDNRGSLPRAPIVRGPPNSAGLVQVDK